MRSAVDDLQQSLREKVSPDDLSKCLQVFHDTGSTDQEELAQQFVKKVLQLGAQEFATLLLPTLPPEARAELFGGSAGEQSFVEKLSYDPYEAMVGLTDRQRELLFPAVGLESDPEGHRTAEGMAQAVVYNGTDCMLEELHRKGLLEILCKAFGVESRRNVGAEEAALLLVSDLMDKMIPLPSWWAVIPALPWEPEPSDDTSSEDSALPDKPANGKRKRPAAKELEESEEHGAQKEEQRKHENANGVKGRHENSSKAAAKRETAKVSEKPRDQEKEKEKKKKSRQSDSSAKKQKRKKEESESTSDSEGREESEDEDERPPRKKLAGDNKNAKHKGKKQKEQEKEKEKKEKEKEQAEEKKEEKEKEKQQEKKYQVSPEKGKPRKGAAKPPKEVSDAKAAESESSSSSGSSDAGQTRPFAQRLTADEKNDLIRSSRHPLEKGITLEDLRDKYWVSELKDYAKSQNLGAKVVNAKKSQLLTALLNHINGKGASKSTSAMAKQQQAAADVEQNPQDGAAPESVGNQASSAEPVTESDVAVLPANGSA